MRKYICAALLLASFSVNGQHYRGPIIDLHVHVAVMPEERTNLGAPNAIEDLLPLMEPNHLSNAGIITIVKAGNNELMRRRNDSILALHDRYPMLIPICSVHPADTSAAFAEMERLHQKGVRILKLHPSAQRFDVAAPEVAAVAARAGKLHIALLFDSYKPEDASEFGKLLMLGVDHPDTKFIFAHMGFVHFAELITIKVWKKYPWYTNNIWLDVSAIAPLFGHSPFSKQIRWIMRQVGVGQFIYGSDFPLFTFEESIAAVRKLGLTKKEEQGIFHDNALRLLESLK